jgi:calcium-dependent protein kinase
MIVNRSKRISAKEIMSHPWLKKDIKASIGNSNINTQGLVQFYKYGRLKRIALTAVAFQLSDHEIENLSKVFTELDQDGDGHLSYNELVKGSTLITQASSS